MKWSQKEFAKLSPILYQLYEDLAPLDGTQILVLCSGEGTVAIKLGEKTGKSGKVVGLDLSEDLLEMARKRAMEEGLEKNVTFQKAERYTIPFPDEVFDSLVSEFILFPAPVITEIGQPEMARVLKPGGKMIITDVIATTPIPEEVQTAFQMIGLEYLCEATQEDFCNWMEDAGLTNVEVFDFTPFLRSIWQQKRDQNLSSGHQKAYTLLLDDPKFRLGNVIFYIYIRGTKS